MSHRQWGNRSSLQTTQGQRKDEQDSSRVCQHSSSSTNNIPAAHHAHAAAGVCFRVVKLTGRHNCGLFAYSAAPMRVFPPHRRRRCSCCGGGVLSGVRCASRHAAEPTACHQTHTSLYAAACALCPLSKRTTTPHARQGQQQLTPTISIWVIEQPGRHGPAAGRLLIALPVSGSV